MAGTIRVGMAKDKQALASGDDPLQNWGIRAVKARDHTCHDGAMALHASAGSVLATTTIDEWLEDSTTTAGSAVTCNGVSAFVMRLLL